MINQLQQNVIEPLLAGRRRLTAVCCLLAGCYSLPAFAQLNENCTVSVLNRNARVAPDGSWRIDNVPSTFGPVRIRAVCNDNGVTKTGQTSLQTIVGGSITGFDSTITLGTSTPIPDSLTITSAISTIASLGASTQLTVTANYPGTTGNVTPAGTGTQYLVSNPAIATVTTGGLVTAVAPGDFIVQAMNEGATAMIALHVVVSADSDGDGIPDAVEIANGLDPRNPVDALEDPDHDGLTNLEEYQRGTDMHNPDTDGDGISDGDEVHGTRGYVTNPLSADTDGDGVRDGLEYATGTNPTNSSSYNLAAVLTRIDIVPSSFTFPITGIPQDAYRDLAVVGKMSDNFPIKLTTGKGTTYSVNNATICNLGALDGRVYAQSLGTCFITATNGTFTATATGLNMAPTELSSIQIPYPGNANSVDVKGNYAYVAAGSTGLVIVNVANPNSPSIAATFDTPGNANDVRVVGNYAYVADGASGLRIVNVTNPLAPVTTATVDTPGAALNLVIYGTRAYIADGASGIAVIDIANPASPVLLAQIPTPGFVKSVDVSGNLAVVVEPPPANMLRVLNIATLGSPSVVGSLALSGQLRRVRVSNTNAFVAAGKAGMYAVDFNLPAKPRISGTVPWIGVAPSDAGNQSTDIRLNGDLAVTAGNWLALDSISDSFSPANARIAIRGDGRTGLALASPYYYMTQGGDSADPGVNGGGSLSIGQYAAIPLQATAGVAPTVSITAPGNGASVVQGSTVLLQTQVADDIDVASDSFAVNGTPVQTVYRPPYQYRYYVPTGTSALNFTAIATDRCNNATTSTPVTLSATTDPLTTVTGHLTDVTGASINGAAVSSTADVPTATSNSSGNFTLSSFASARGNIVVDASITTGGTVLTGSSLAVAPAAGGTTNVGTIVLKERFVLDSNLGTRISTCQFCSVTKTIPFAFPFAGANRTSLFVNSTGQLTFTSAETTQSAWYNSSLDFNSQPRIAVLRNDPPPDMEANDGVYWNELPGRVVITWKVYSMISAQVILYPDGDFQFLYGPAHRDGAVGIGYPAVNVVSPGLDYASILALPLHPPYTALQIFTPEIGNSTGNQLPVGISWQPTATGDYIIRVKQQ